MSQYPTISHVNLARGYRGGERQTELLIRQLAERGYHQQLVVRKAQPLVSKMVGVPNLTITQLSKPFALHIKRATGDIIHAHDGHGAKFAVLAGKINRTPSLITRRVVSKPSKSWRTGWTFNNANQVVGLTSAVISQLIEYSPTLNPVKIASASGALSTDNEAVEALKTRYQEKFVLVCVAALVNAHKGQAYLIDAAQKLAQTSPNIQFVLLGEGKDKEQFLERARGLHNIEFKGFVENVGDYLAAADAFILPSLHEALGSSCLDALAFGLPVLASHVGGIPEIIEQGENGLLFPPKDPEAIGNAVLKIYEDKDLREKMRENNLAKAQQFTPEAMAERYVEVYKSLSVG